MAKKTDKKNISLDVTKILKKPRVTEKSSRSLEGNVYTFDIDPRTTKVEVKKAIEVLYNVSPQKVNVVVLKRKNVTVRGRSGVKGGGKKAMVYLKKGDTIEFA